MATRKTICLIAVLVCLAGDVAGLAAAEEQSRQAVLLCDQYPWLAQGSLTYARLARLPEGVVLRSGDLTIKAEQIEQQISSAPQQVQAQLRANACYILENMATRQLLLRLARADLAGTDQMQLLEGFLKGLVADVNVSDGDVERFYQENKDAIGPVGLEQVKDQIRQLLLQQRQRERLQTYVQTLGKRMPIEVSDSWARTQATLAKENPVDKARSSGLPSLVDFGSAGCIPCQMMAPILDKLGSEYAGRLNVVFVHTGHEQVLAARYQIEAIPTQIFYDKNGREVYRHVGFMPEEQIRQQLKQMGID
ncbi:MAG: thioredoxin domain-containing protein [Sedimentisphaerales bacterium]|nr:thioredoxin domain-containing protein [Sedimentisphaerales bacterium]